MVRVFIFIFIFLRVGYKDIARKKKKKECVYLNLKGDKR